MRRALATIGALAAIAAGGCGDDRPTASAPFPRDPVPAAIGDLAVEEEPSGADAFAEAGPRSMVVHGKVWSMRRDGEVEAAFQLAQLEPRFDTDDIEVRRGVRGTIERGRYRWFKRDGRWVGVQELPEVHLYLWFPERDDLFALLQVRPDATGVDEILDALLEHEAGAA